MDNQNKEIDLIEVFNKLIKKTYKNIFLFVSIVIVFVVLGFVYNSTNKETYTFSTIATSTIDKEVLLKFVSDFNNKNTEENKLIPKLEKILLSDDDFEKKHIYNLDLILNDTTNVKSTITNIKQVIYDIDYVKTFISKEKESLMLRIKNYSDEIEKIDSIQNLVFKKNNSASTIISTNGLSKTKIDFKNEILKLTRELNQVTVLNVINSKYYFFESNNKELQDIIFSVFLGVFFGVIAIFIKK